MKSLSFISECTRPLYWDLPFIFMFSTPLWSKSVSSEFWTSISPKSYIIVFTVALCTIKILSFFQYKLYFLMKTVHQIRCQCQTKYWLFKKVLGFFIISYLSLSLLGQTRIISRDYHRFCLEDWVLWLLLLISFFHSVLREFFPEVDGASKYLLYSVTLVPIVIVQVVF